MPLHLFSVSAIMSGNQHSISRPYESGPVCSWIHWFTGLQGHDFLCRVPNDYILDRFNLTGLETAVPNFNVALQTILDPEFEPEVWDKAVDTVHAETLYGLIHARYILTSHGLEAMCKKYERGEFGICPRFYCKGQNTLPIGLSDLCGHSHVKLYCPRCLDVYQPRSRCCLLDGAMFGTGFPHMFFMQLPELRPHPPDEKYVGRLFGFQLHHSALTPLESPDRVDLTKSNSVTLSQSRRQLNRFHFLQKH
ncbi:suppressor-of-stellate-like protein isoform X2 [Drosophila kikkawai]|uniref:Suppressor-of-stellate-like protein isoform X2 n=1 Tax=Drosophila kikkawai TaxID=30033 RepID=A0A6P4HXV9_DROKI|nr:suppressor-of-stellate-like protein isoform X1 [Drosophila kikkawai]